MYLQAFAHAYFDGKLFQHIYQNATYGVSQEVLLEDQVKLSQFNLKESFFFIMRYLIVFIDIPLL